MKLYEIKFEVDNGTSYNKDVALVYENTAHKSKTYRCKKCGKEYMYRCD